MFIADSRFEIHIPPFLEECGSTHQQFQVVEQCFNVPLWHIQVLPRITYEDEFQRWRCYLASRGRDALTILSAQLWENTKLHVVLPPYMTGTASIAMSRCFALWDCRRKKGRGDLALLFDTTAGSFIDPEFEVNALEVERIDCLWQDPEFQA